MRMMGSRMPFTSWLSRMTLTSGRWGMMATGAGTKMKNVSRPLKTGASANFLSSPLSKPKASQIA